MRPSANNRIVVCSSSAGRCSSTGGANARFNVPAGDTGLEFAARVSGYTFRNLDFMGTNKNGQGFHTREFPVSHITFDGGLFDSFTGSGCDPWFQASEGIAEADAIPCSHMELGTIGNPLNFSHSGMNAFYGWLEDSWVRITGVDNGRPGSDREHILYLSTGPYQKPMRNVVIEHSQFVANSQYGPSHGMILNLSTLVDGLEIRNNNFIQSARDGHPACTLFAIDIGSGEDYPESYKNVKIHHNYFRTDCQHDINLLLPGQYKIYDNVFEKMGQSNSNEGAILVNGVPSGSANVVEFINNTVSLCSQSDCPTELFLTQANAPTTTFSNNLVYSRRSGVNSSSVFTGTGTVSKANNFFFIPNGGATTSPGVVNGDAGDFHLLPSSPLRGAGRTLNAPVDDFDNRVRPVPPSIGAFDNP